jgi:hypothetical protein
VTDDQFLGRMKAGQALLAAALGVPAEAVAVERFDESRVSVTLTATTGHRTAILAPADGWQAASVGPLRQWIDEAGASFASKRPDKAA